MGHVVVERTRNRRRQRPAPRPARPRPGPVAVLAVAVPLAWLVPLLADRAGLAVLLPPVVWLATAALLGGDTTLVDRLVIALGALIGAASVAGLALSVWPAHLSPVPVAGTALTALALVRAAMARRPRPRRRWFAPRDVPVVVIGVLAAAIGWAPLAGRDTTGRLAVLMSGEDLSRHFMIFDWIRRTGGYLFITGVPGGRLAPGFVIYPQGSHLVAALLERFRRPVGSLDVDTSFHDYVDFTVGSYVLLAVAVAWAVGWVWAGRLRPPWAVVSYAVVAAVACFGSYVTMITRGYPSQMVGLALLVMLVALACRPALPSRERLVLPAVLFVGVSFAYYFYLPIAAVVLAARAWSYRSRPRVWPVPVVAVWLVAAALAAVMPAVNISAQTVPGLAYGGPAVAPSKVWLVVLTVAGTASLAGRGRPVAWPAWRDPVRRTLAVAVAAALGLAAVLLGTAFVLGPGVTYYVDKALYGLLSIELILFGGLAASAAEFAAGGRGSGGRGHGRARAAAVRGRRWAPAVGVATALAVLGGAGALDPRPARASSGFLPHPASGSSYGRAYAEGRLALPVLARAVTTAVRERRPAPGGRLIIFWDAYGRGFDFYAAQWANVLDRRLSAASYAAMVRIPLPRVSDGQLDALLASVTTGPSGMAVEVVTRSDATAARVAAFSAAHPGTDITVLRLAGG